MEDKREFDPIHGQFADGNTMVCWNCAYRDKMTVDLDGKRIACGVTKAFCDKYSTMPNLKPKDIRMYGAKCQYYKEDSSAPPYIQDI